MRMCTGVQTRRRAQIHGGAGSGNDKHRDADKVIDTDIQRQR